MPSWITVATEIMFLFVGAAVVSWMARTIVRTMTRRAVRRAQRSDGTWRARLDRLGDNGQGDVRRRQRADSVARMIGRVVTVVVFTVATFVALELAGVNLAFAISSAGFIGLALAFGGQDLVKDFLAVSRALLEDRYDVGDEVVLRVGGSEVRGTVDLIGSASVRLRTPDGATWHAGHHAVESVANLSQLPAISDIEVPLEDWASSDERAAAERLAVASNDVGLTGVVFLRDIETHEPDSAGSEDPIDTVTVRVSTNRPLTSPETAIVRDRLLDR
jgi:small conductance mechanosensitive channel